MTKTPSPSPVLPALRTPKEIFDLLSQFVIGQEEAKKALSIGAYHHLRRLHVNFERRLHGDAPLLRKANILLIGPTGSGKTHLARTLARILDLPMVVSDATEYTEAGYYGKDVEVMVAELLHATDNDVIKAQQGIIFIDEFDKIAGRQGGMRTGAGSKDIGGTGVQQSLLRLLEGEKLFIPLNVTQHWNQHDFVQMDVSEILFICSGAFSDMRGFEEKAVSGFSNVEALRKNREVSTRELIKYGFLAELLGRLPVVVTLDQHDLSSMRRILTEPKDAIINEFIDVLALDGIDLEVTDSALDTIAETAIKSDAGARGLRNILMRTLRDIMFEAPSRRLGATITIDREYVLQQTEAIRLAQMSEPA